MIRFRFQILHYVIQCFPDTNIRIVIHAAVYFFIIHTHNGIIIAALCFLYGDIAVCYLKCKLCFVRFLLIFHSRLLDIVSRGVLPFSLCLFHLCKHLFPFLSEINNFVPVLYALRFRLLDTLSKSGIFRNFFLLLLSGSCLLNVFVLSFNQTEKSRPHFFIGNLLFGIPESDSHRIIPKHCNGIIFAYSHYPFISADKSLCKLLANILAAMHTAGYIIYFRLRHHAIAIQRFFARLESVDIPVLKKTIPQIFNLIPCKKLFRNQRCIVSFKELFFFIGKLHFRFVCFLRFFALQRPCKFRKLRKSKGIYKMGSIFPVLMQHHDVADGKGMSLVVCRVIYIKLFKDCFQRFPLRLSLQFGQFTHINQVVILPFNGIKIVLCNAHAFQCFRPLKAELS